MTMTNEIRDQIKAMVSLAHYQSRRSVVYRQWAQQAKQMGHDEKADNWFAESARYRVSAGWYIAHAMQRKDAHL